MTPRWKEGWTASFDLRFIGGYERFDLWAHTEDPAGDIRVVWGEGPTLWHYALIPPGAKSMVLHKSPNTALLADPPTQDELQDLYKYVSLFAPWVIHATQVV